MRNVIVSGFRPTMVYDIDARMHNHISPPQPYLSLSRTSFLIKVYLAVSPDLEKGVT